MSDCGEQPRDSDSDGTPDYQDVDSDGNGKLDLLQPPNGIATSAAEAFEVILNARPMPPVARITARHRKSTNRPVSRQ